MLGMLGTIILHSSCEILNLTSSYQAIVSQLSDLILTSCVELILAFTSINTCQTSNVLKM